MIIFLSTVAFSFISCKPVSRCEKNWNMNIDAVQRLSDASNFVRSVQIILEASDIASALLEARAIARNIDNKRYLKAINSIFRYVEDSAKSSIANLELKGAIFAVKQFDYGKKVLKATNDLPTITAQLDEAKRSRDSDKMRRAAEKSANILDIARDAVSVGARLGIDDAKELKRIIENDMKSFMSMSATCDTKYRCGDSDWMPSGSDSPSKADWENKYFCRAETGKCFTRKEYSPVAGTGCPGGRGSFFELSCCQVPVR